jgi:hypothetical protein
MGMSSPGTMTARGGRHLYALTPAGRELWPALQALLTWGGRHRAPSTRLFRHAPCGTVLDGTGRCARCETTPGPDEIATEPIDTHARSR